MAFHEIYAATINTHLCHHMYEKNECKKVIIPPNHRTHARRASHPMRESSSRASRLGAMDADKCDVIVVEVERVKKPIKTYMLYVVGILVLM